MLDKKTALLIVDVQNDFLPPKGTLAVPAGNDVIPFINTIISNYSTVIATQDWHPPHHVSFASSHQGHKIGDIIEVQGLSQMLWPDHCVQDTHGAALSDELNTSAITHVIKKGTNVQIDSYSGFFDNNKIQETGLHQLLQDLEIRTVHICGLATDYCVKYTACDAALLGYTTVVLQKGCRAVNIQDTDEVQAIKEMIGENVYIEAPL